VLEAENTKLRKEQEEVRAELERLKIELKGLRERKELTSDYTELKTENSLKSKEIASYKQTNRELAQKVQKLEKDKANFSENNSKLQKQLEAKSQEVQILSK
jgi:hypothetical protein